MQFCNSLNCNLAGFSSHTNPLFRKKKWVFNVLADGRVLIVKKTKLRWDTNVQSIDDYCWTAQNLKEFGKVVVNMWLAPNCRRYTAGGYGNKESRMQRRRQEVEYMVNTYPNQIKIAPKKHWPYGTHVQIARSGIKQEVWR